MDDKYSDVIADWLVELGYTTFFYLGGGQVMHLLESCSRKMRGIPVVHEVAAGIAAEYFNEVAEGERAFALVTAGPGMTNLVTAIAGAWTESRELLVIGGQVKTADLSRGEVRQRGIQEIDGVAIAKPITVASVRLDKVHDREAFKTIAEAGSIGRKGPVFIEVPLDIQAAKVDAASLAAVKSDAPKKSIPVIAETELAKLAERVRKAERPVLLIGGGVSRATAALLQNEWAKMGVPLTTTYNGCDRVGSEHPLYFGRPNTWGMRYSNLVLQQADLVIALGTRLGMQQTGFNWQEFVPVGKIVQVDCDKAELEKGHPKVDTPLHGDANQVLLYLSKQDLGQHKDWIAYCNEIKAALPLNDKTNQTGEGFVSPYLFNQTLSSLCNGKDVVVPCSSGGAFTVTFQSFLNKQGQKMFADKSLASMGYGLSGAIGAAFAAKDKRVILIEGDGGFSQNIQEIGTVAINKLNIKIFIFNDDGYASIRMTQRSYFGGKYLGCDTNTGLGLPKFEKLFPVYDIPVMRLRPGFENEPEFQRLFASDGPVAFIVSIDPLQTYFPKITSSITKSGSMQSNPLHKMSPDLDDAVYAKLGRYLPK